MHWSIHVDRAGHPGWYQMALDQALLDDAERSAAGTVRLYHFLPHCLSFGRHEPALRRYDRPAISALGLDVVRRPTGGRAVWHARELTYSIVAPSTALGELRESGRRIHEVIVTALGRLGATATLAPDTRTPSLHSGACFQGAVGGEILVGGRKLAGSAQLRQGAVLLQHGSLLLEEDQSLVSRLSRVATPPGGEITLTEVLGRQVGFEEIADLAGAAFRQWLGPLEMLPDDAATLLVARCADHFRDPAWTWRR